MKWCDTIVLTTAACVLTAWTAGGQSLAEAAAKEKERRAKTKAGKTYTESELRSAGQGFSPEATADAAAAGSTEGAATAGSKPAAATDPAAKAEDESAKRQKDYSDRYKAAESEHKQWTDEVARIQGLLNDNTVDPYGPARQAATTALAAAQAKATESQQKLSDLEEEGRRNRLKR